MTKEVMAIANIVPEDMPFPGENRPVDPTRDWLAAHNSILAATVGFTEFPLADIAREVVGRAKGWRKGEGVEFARKTAGVIRFVARYDWDGPVPPKRWNYPLIEMYETRIEPQYKSRCILVRENRLANLYSKLKWWLSKIDGARLRECAVCKRLYYAARRDQSACGSVCAHRLRSRKWYATHGKNQRKEQEEES